MSQQIHRLHHLRHAEVVTHARKQIEQSRILLEKSSASTFLGSKNYDPPLCDDYARHGKTRVALRAIDGNRGQRGKIASSVGMEWQRIRIAPFCRDLELAVINAGGVHALVFPCRRVLRGWVKAKTNEDVDVHPTHWREWMGSNSALFSIGLSS